jgi:hypothetical protein
MSAGRIFGASVISDSRSSSDLTATLLGTGFGEAEKKTSLTEKNKQEIGNNEIAKLAFCQSFRQQHAVIKREGEIEVIGTCMEMQLIHSLGFHILRFILVDGMHDAIGELQETLENSNENKNDSEIVKQKDAIT